MHVKKNISLAGNHWCQYFSTAHEITQFAVSSTIVSLKCILFHTGKKKKKLIVAHFNLHPQAISSAPESDR